MKPRFYAEYSEVQDQHWWFVGRRRIFRSILDQHLSVGRGDRRVLDVGCGTGAMLEDLARYGETEGIDSNPEAIRFCIARGLDRVRLVEPGPLPHDSASVDLLTALDVVEHVDDDAGLMREFARVLRPGGTVLVSAPAYRWMWGQQDVIAEHKRRYVAGELRERVLGAGLRLQRLTYFNTLLFPAVAAIRIARALGPEPSEIRSDFELTRPGLLNDLLSAAFSVEARLLRRVTFPFGVSLLALATKDAD